MELRELGYFVAVFEERSISAAARRCFISQPSVSAAIAVLESELGAKLFVRHRRGAAPTAAAEQLYPTARRLVGEVHALRAAFRTPPVARRLTVGLMRSLDAYRIRELLLVVTSAPGLQLRLVGADERSDLRVVSRGLVRAAETFVPLWSERFVVALPANHPLALRDTLRAADLVGQRLVERCHCEHARRFARGRRRLDPVAVAQSEEWALALVGAGVGIAIVPEGVARDDGHVVLRPLADVGVSRQVGLAWRTTSAMSTAVQELCEKLQQRFAATVARVAPPRRAASHRARR
jgi:DNA-binding transcriptional LysR family regulator